MNKKIPVEPVGSADSTEKEVGESITKMMKEIHIAMMKISKKHKFEFPICTASVVSVGGEIPKDAAAVTGFCEIDLEHKNMSISHITEMLQHLDKTKERLIKAGMKLGLKSGGKEFKEQLMKMIEKNVNDS